MRCPECGTVVAEEAKACPYCGRYLGEVTATKTRAWPVRIVLVIMVIALIAGAAYAALLHFQKEASSGSEHNHKAQWAPMEFPDYGLTLEVPGAGWSVYYDAKSQVIFRGAVYGELDINFLGAKTANPEAHKVTNAFSDYTLVEQSTIFIEGVGETEYIIISVDEGTSSVKKHQLFFKHTSQGQGSPQTFTYVITLTYPLGQEGEYGSIFQHIIGSIKLN